MIYRAIGLMSGSSLDGLDIVFAELDDSNNKWSFEIKAADCYEYDRDWTERLTQASTLNARDYFHLNAMYGQHIAELVNKFIDANNLHHRVQLIASHGHTVFHEPGNKFTTQLGDGATIAAITGINVVSDLRALDVALGGQGAPIVPVGEKLLFSEYDYFLNIGGIANLSFKPGDGFIAFDVCPANRILNLLAQKKNKLFDEDGTMAAAGKLYTPLLTRLNALGYYAENFPKSLANTYGADVVFPLVESFQLPVEDALRTYVEHIVQQVVYAVLKAGNVKRGAQMMVTGGGAFNSFLIKRLKESLQGLEISVIVPDERIVKYKEALIMSLLGVLRWREENTTLQSVTGASRNSIGGAVWIGQEA